MKYVAMELTQGKLPDGKQYVKPGGAARTPGAAGDGQHRCELWHGFSVNTMYGTQGDPPRRRHDRLSQRHDLAARAWRRCRDLTNGDPGWIIRGVFRRKLLEVLFDGKPEADGQVVAQARRSMTSWPASASF